MASIKNAICAFLLLAGLAPSVVGQKVKVGYDKTVDFSKYKTYTWAEPTMPPTRPFVHGAVVDSVDYELKNKGLQRTDKDGDLLLAGAGGIAFGASAAAGAPVLSVYGSPPIFPTTSVWTGSSGTLPTATSYVPQGALQLQFVDRATNRVVWNGNVSTNLDMERQKESLDRIYKGITKLLKGFPPKNDATK